MTTTQDTAASVRAVRQHTIGDLLHRTAARYPDKIGIVHAGRRYSFAEVNATVNRTAHALAARDIAKGDRVALLSRNSYQFAVAYFALAKLGAISVPVNFMLTAAEVAFILDHAEAKAFLVEDALASVATEAMAAADKGTVALHGWLSVENSPAPDGWQDVAAWMAHDDASEPEVSIADDDPLQLMYTSGTESRPKGVTLTSKCLITQYVSVVVDGEMTNDDVEIHSLPMYHCAQLHCFLTPDVYLGATSVIVPAPDPKTLLETVQREKATKLFCPPTVWIALLRSPYFDSCDLSSLRKGYYGAAIMPGEIIQELSRRLPNMRLWNFYGQTEMSPLATILPPALQLEKLGSAGKACLNCETSVVDDDGHPVGVGEVGEIVHRSPHATLGYWNDPEKTADAFRDGWFHSGDLGVLDDDGFLTVVDRKKDMIKTGGENVASREVEEVLYAHPDVAEVAVIGIPHPYWIEAVTAIVVPRAGASLDAGEVQGLCKEKLAGFKVPKYVAIAESLPKNPSGKILKRELRESYVHLVAEES